MMSRRLESRKELKFTVIVNPNSGPGNESLPNEQYREAVAQLRKYPNVELLGYVRTDYAKRSIDDVIRDIKVYAGWPAYNASLTMNGIFLDEAPHQYSADAVDFMRGVGREIKNANGLREPKTVRISALNPHAQVRSDRGILPSTAFPLPRSSMPTRSPMEYLSALSHREQMTHDAETLTQKKKFKKNYRPSTTLAPFPTLGLMTQARISRSSSNTTTTLGRPAAKPQ